MKCDKCLTDNPIFERYAYPTDKGLSKVTLCRLCNGIYTANLLPEFMKEDFGSFPISDISKNMINARKKRALGEHLWENTNR